MREAKSYSLTPLDRVYIVDRERGGEEVIGSYAEKYHKATEAEKPNAG